LQSAATHKWNCSVLAAIQLQLHSSNISTFSIPLHWNGNEYLDPKTRKQTSKHAEPPEKCQKCKWSSKNIDAKAIFINGMQQQQTFSNYSAETEKGSKSSRKLLTDSTF